MTASKAQRSKKLRPADYIKRILSVLLVTLLAVIIAAFGALWILFRGPSPTMQKLFTLSVKETSAIGFLADIFLPKDVLQNILAQKDITAPADGVDTSLIKVRTNIASGDKDPSGGETADPEKGITVEKVTGPSFRGYMMIVDDPKRVFVGVPDGLGTEYGDTLINIVKKYDAVAGINAGGFYDLNGSGGGGIPDGIVICDGKLLYGPMDVVVNVIGIDGDGILQVGYMTARTALSRGVKFAVSFGPTLIVNGVAQNETGTLASGVNPRTAIGQREDGAMLLLVLDGRQIDSLGATYEDLVGIMLDYGAVNAANLDGGSSTLMIYNDEILNVCASVVGIRALPTAFLVK